MLRVGVLISGEGTNLQAILDASKAESSPYQVVIVISNREEAFGLTRAKRAGIPAIAVRHQDYESREAFEEVLIKKLSETEVGLVVLAGFMRLLSKRFVDRYRGRIMNIHPALLPAFPGTHAIEKAWGKHVKETGVTVHLVDEGIDTGPIILQKAVSIEDGETLAHLEERIHKVEHELYPEAIRLFALGRI